MSMTTPPEFDAYIQQAVSAGLYPTPQDAMQEALRLLRERDRARQSLREDIRQGFDEIARGEFIELDDEGLERFFDQIQEEGQARYDAARRRP